MRPRARRALVVVAGSAALTVAVTGWLTYRGLAARDELTAARVSLGEARTALLDQRLDDADRAIVEAGWRTAKATRLTSDPVFRAVARVPVAGRTVAVARRLAVTADDLARDLLPDALGVARSLDPQQLRSRDGRIDVALLARRAPALRELSARAEQASAKTGALPRAFVAGPVRQGRDDLAGQVQELASGLRGASRAVDLAPALLGGDRPRRYFVLIQQTSESRGTGGLPGGFAILEADGGRLRVTAQGANNALRSGPISAPPGVGLDYVDLYEPQGALDLWVNVNLSPDLPTVARVIAARWKQQSGQAVDGVVALDARALSALLRGSGPIDLGDRRISAEQLPDYLAIGQYADFQPRRLQTRRKDRLAVVATLAARRLTEGGGSTPDLLRGLSEAVRSGHLRMASDDPALHGSLEAAGITGALPRGDQPLAYPVIYNSSGGKLDYFLDRAVNYRSGACFMGRRRSTITVTVRNSAPADGLPPYVRIFNHEGVERLSYDNAVTLSVYAMRGALLETATLDGQPLLLLRQRPGGNYLSAATESGLPVWSLYLDLPRGVARTLTLELDEPLVPGEQDVDVPEQPLARPLTVTSATGPCD